MRELQMDTIALDAFLGADEKSQGHYMGKPGTPRIPLRTRYEVCLNAKKGGR